jgi:hypothetical protein
MKNLYLLLAPLAFMAGCKKDHASAPSTNPANYELLAYANYYNGALTDSIGFTYLPNTHLLNSYTVVAYGAAGTDTSTYQVIYANEEVTRINIVSMTYSSYYNYYYNTGNQLDSIDWYTGNGDGPHQSWTFEYNAAGQVSDEFVYARPSLQDHFSYTYAASGNISEVFDSTFTRSVSVDTLQYSNYDNKVNVLTAIPGFPKCPAPLPASGLQFFSSPNNYGTIAQSIEIATGQYQTNTTNLTYQYNVAGLPTAIINGMDTLKLTYKQF